MCHEEVEERISAIIVAPAAAQPPPPRQIPAGISASVDPLPNVPAAPLPNVPPRPSHMRSPSGHGDGPPDVSGVHPSVTFGPPPPRLPMVDRYLKSRLVEIRKTDLSSRTNMEAETVCVETWLSENKKDFVPPVCNKCMFAKQLKVFYVGGPNSRKDYHLEEGEEFFYQKQGDMVLKVIEHGQPRDIVIKEGEIFLLPSRVEHSPQRFANTIGFVVERTRKNTEFDCVRYFVEPSTERLFERWFHLQDVVRDLPPLIKAFHSSDEFKTGAPGQKSFLVNAPYEPVPLQLEEPINLHKFIESQKDRLKDGPVQIYGPPKYSTRVYLYGEGKHLIEASDYEHLIWIMNNSEALLEQRYEFRNMHSLSMTVCPPKMRCYLDVRKGQLITIQMMPKF